jgi:sec-independent protein translocase protein TatB
MGQVRRVSGHFRAGIETMIREAEMEEMERKWKEQNAAIMAAHPATDAAEGQSVEAAADQNGEVAALPPPEPEVIDPEVAAVAPTEMLPISQRPERSRGPGGGAA